MTPMSPAARVQLPNAALQSLTQATVLSGSGKCVAISKQRVTAIEDCECKLLPGVALTLLV